MLTATKTKKYQKISLTKKYNSFMEKTIKFTERNKRRSE